MSEARQLIDAIAHRMPSQINVYPSVNTAVSYIAKRLFWHQSNMILSATGLDVDFTTGDSTASLPADFWGLSGKPYINGRKWHLDPLPSLLTKLQHTSNGISKYYRVLGNYGSDVLELTPPTSSDITINGDYFAKPTEIKAPADTIPWNGVFDDAIQEFLIKWYVVGSGGKAEQILSLKDFFNDAVDSVVPIRDKTAPAHITEEIDWSGMVEESMC